MKADQTAEQAQNRRKLVDALRGGKYKQVRGRLRLGDRFCCLGVACDISGLGEWEDCEYCVDGWYSECTMPVRVQRHYGFSAAGLLPYSGYESLVAMNDRGCSFEEIADAIESRSLS